MCDADDDALEKMYSIVTAAPFAGALPLAAVETIADPLPSTSTKEAALLSWVFGSNCPSNWNGQQHGSLAGLAAK